MSLWNPHPFHLLTLNLNPKSRMEIRHKDLTKKKKPYETWEAWHQDQPYNLWNPVEHENMGSLVQIILRSSKWHGSIKSSSGPSELKALYDCTGHMFISGTSKNSGWETLSAPLPELISPEEEFFWGELMFKEWILINSDSCHWRQA